MEWKTEFVLAVSFVVFLMIGMILALYVLGRYRIEMQKYRTYLRQYDLAILEIRERQHTFANQLDAVYAMFVLYTDYDSLVSQQKKELDRLGKYLEPVDILILGRPLVIAHIHNKTCEAEKRGIPVKTVFHCGIQDLKIPDIFLVEIIGNLLDNAMDEMGNQREIGQIQLQIRNVGTETAISVSNQHEYIPYMVYCHFFQKDYSTKGVNRGLGLPYVKKIVKRYHGRIEMGNVKEQNISYFQISIYFPNPEIGGEQKPDHNESSKKFQID